MTTPRILAVAAAVAVVALLARLSLLSYGLYALMLALLASELLARFSLDRVDCLRDVRVDRAKIGEQVVVSTIIKNNKPIPVPWMLAEDALPRRLPVSGETTRLLVLGPYADARLHYTVTMAHRGYHQIGPAVLESGDLFGFVRKFRAARKAHYVTVQPDTVPILKYDVASRRPIGEVKVRRLLHDDPSRLAGVREYERGDPLNRIHWKATARTGELHSKVYEHTTLAGAMVAMDFHGPSFEGEEDRQFIRSEMAVKVAASLAAYLVNLRQQVGFISNGLDAAERAKRDEGLLDARSRGEARGFAASRGGGDRLRPVEVVARKGHDQAMAVLDALARLELSDGCPFEQMLLEEHTRLPRDLTLLVIVPRMTPLLYQVLARVRFSGFSITVFLVDNAEQAEGARVVLASEGIGFMHVARLDDLQHIAQSGI